jgi:hypothetical protein
VGQHLEAKFRILVQQVQSSRRAGGAMPVDEILLAQERFQELADSFSSCRTRIGLQRRAAIGDEMGKIV